MSAHFLDSSSLVKRYAREQGTKLLITIFRKKPEHTIFVSRITLVEVSSALVRKAFAMQIAEASEERSSRRLQREFQEHFSIVEVTQNLVSEAVRVARLYHLRGYDAIQLASAVQVSSTWRDAGMESLVFMSADSDLNAAALSEELLIQNPNDIEM